MTLKKKIFILGVGNNTAIYVELAEALGYSIAGLYHYQSDRVGEHFCGYPIVGCHQELLESNDLSDCSFALSMGNNVIRSNLSGQIRERGGHVPKLINPMATVSRFSHLDEGVVVHSNGIIEPNVKIERDSVVSFNALVAHDVVIEPAVFVAGSSVVGAYTCIHQEALVGIGSVIISGKVNHIGRNAVLGAGSVVTKDVESYTIVAGNPAKVMGKVTPAPTGE